MSNYLYHIDDSPRPSGCTALPDRTTYEPRCEVCESDISDADYLDDEVVDFHWHKCGELSFITPAHRSCAETVIEASMRGGAVGDSLRRRLDV